MICYSIGNPHRPVNEIEADELIDLIAGRSRLEKRYAYLIMHMDMFKHAIELRNGDDKPFWQLLERQPHWFGIPIIIDDYALEPVYLMIMPVMIFSGYLDYPRKVDMADNRVTLEDQMDYEFNRLYAKPKSLEQ